MRARVSGVAVDELGNVRGTDPDERVYGRSVASGPGRAWTTKCAACDAHWFGYSQDRGLKRLRDHWTAAHAAPQSR